MKRMLASVVGLLAHQVVGHGGCLNYTVGDTWYPGYVQLTRFLTLSITLSQIAIRTSIT
jgi:hypothetical protein